MQFKVPTKRHKLSNDSPKFNNIGRNKATLQPIIFTGVLKEKHLEKEKQIVIFLFCVFIFDLFVFFGFVNFFLKRYVKPCLGMVYPNDKKKY